MANHEASLAKFTAEHEMLKDKIARAKELIMDDQKRFTQVKKNIAKLRILMRKAEKR